MLDPTIEEIIDRAVHKAIAEVEVKHVCYLSVDERAMVHAEHEAMKEEGANHGTFRILFQWGVTIKDITKQVRRSILWVLCLIMVAFGSKLIFKW